MFDNLTDKFDAVFRKLRGHGQLSEATIQEALREVRLALLEADVNFRVVKDFITSVKERALGQDVLKSLTPAQQVVKIVRDELSRLMGSDIDNSLALQAKPPVVVMLCGLQGAGKTTTCGKLALRLRREKRNPLLVPADVYRPAAIEQLKILGRQLDVPVFDSSADQDPVEICKAAHQFADLNGFDTLILDTAGRLHVDEQLMQELQRIEQALSPQELLFVADAMTGQDAVTIAGSFSEQLPLTGVILTKLDGDARGGAALSIRAVTGLPVKLVGMGEKLDALELFHPERMAQRILGMGDVLSLIEKAETAVSEDDAAAMAESMRRGGFNLEQFRDQLKMIKKMGSMESIMGMVPGMGKAVKKAGNAQIPENELKKVEAIINSMTRKERYDHRILNGSRRQRIARGSGTSVQDVNQLIKRFMDAQKMMKKMQKLGPKGLKSLAGSGRLPF